MCGATATSRRTVDPEVSLSGHLALTLHSYPGLMSRSSAWQSLRGRTRSSRPANTPKPSLSRSPRTAANIAAEHMRPVWPSDSKLEEWKALEFRQLKPPSDEDWNR
jgi:hypothetical protein